MNKNLTSKSSARDAYFDLGAKVELLPGEKMSLTGCTAVFEQPQQFMVDIKISQKSGGNGPTSQALKSSNWTSSLL